MARPTLRQPITTRRVIVMRDGSTGAPEEGSSLPGIRELELRTLSLKIGQMEHDVADARKRAEVAQQQWETSVGASKEVFGSTLIRHNAEVTDGLQVLGQLRQREQQLRSGQQYQVKDVRDDQQFPDSRAQTDQLAVATKMTVQDLFESVGLSLHSDPLTVWTNIFKTKPTWRLRDSTGMSSLRCLLAVAQQEHVQAERDRLQEQEVGVGRTDVEHSCDSHVIPTDSLVARLSLLFLTAFPGSGKSHHLRLLGEQVNKLRAGDDVAARNLLDAPNLTTEAEDGKFVSAEDSGTPRFDQSTLQWAKKLKLIGVNFNSERWSLNESGSDGSMARHPGGALSPLHLRILFFALADLNDADAAETVWSDLGTKCAKAFNAGTLSPHDLEVAVVALLRRRCGAVAPHAPLLILLDELSKCDGFCADVYAKDVKRPTAPKAFRSAACSLANKVNGRVLLASLDDELPRTETQSSGRVPVEAVKLPPFPMVELFTSVLGELSVSKDLHLSYRGHLVKAGTQGGRPQIVAQAEALANVVGADVRHAAYLASFLSSACSGQKLSAILRSSARSANLSYADIWSHSDCDFIFAHSLRCEYVRAADTLPSGCTWDSVRRSGLIQAVGGPRFHVKLPLYVAWVLHACDGTGRIFPRTLYNMIGGVDGQLRWRAWEVIWVNLEVLLPYARSLVANSKVGDLAATSRKCDALVKLFPSTSHFGRKLVSRCENPAFLPLCVEERSLPKLLLRFLNQDRSLTSVVWQTEDNTAAVDSLLFAVNEDYQMVIRASQVKQTTAVVQQPLSWGQARDLVQNMRLWLAIATWLALSGDPMIQGYSKAEEWRTLRTGFRTAFPAVADEPNDAVVDEEAVLRAFLTANWAHLPRTPASIEDVLVAVFSVLQKSSFVVALQRPRGASFFHDRRVHLRSYMDDAIVMTQEDLPEHAGSFLSSVVTDCGRTANTSFSAEPTVFDIDQ